MQDLKLRLPEEALAKEAFWRFCRTVAQLRHPQNGCPWDLKQNHATLRKYMIEEAYEAVDVMSADAGLELADELGDVLLQVVLNAQLACDRDGFSIVDVIEAIDRKMRHRHPHVFEPGFLVESEAEIKTNWQRLKEREAEAITESEGAGDRSNTFRRAYGKGPATYQALTIGKIAEQIDFDWNTPADVLAHLRSEIDELEAEIVRGKSGSETIKTELGDVYFTLAQLARHLDIDPELAALEGNQKFLRRFRDVEVIAVSEGLDNVAQVDRDALNRLWERAKSQS